MFHFIVINQSFCSSELGVQPPSIILWSGYSNSCGENIKTNVDLFSEVLEKLFIIETTVFMSSFYLQNGILEEISSLKYGCKNIILQIEGEYCPKSLCIKEMLH